MRGLLSFWVAPVVFSVLLLAAASAPIRSIFEPRASIPAVETWLQGQLVDDANAIDTSVMVERPLFDPRRRPPQPIVVPESKVEQVRARLVAPQLEGTMRRRDGMWVAYFRFDGESESRRLTAGDEFAGWRIVGIDELGATIADGEQETTLTLN